MSNARICTPRGAGATALALLFVASVSAYAQVVPAVPLDTVVTMSRTCFLHGDGDYSCPAFTVRVDATGAVDYTGEANVRVEGSRTGRIEVREVAELLAFAQRIRFFDLQDQYIDYRVSDLPEVRVTIVSGGRQKRVLDYLGAPNTLKAFEAAIEDATRVRQWVAIDREELRSLMDQGRLPSQVEFQRLVAYAARGDDTSLLRDLLAVAPDSVAIARLFNWADARSRECVRLVVGAGGLLAFDGRRETPLWEAVWAPGVVTRALLEAGANPRERSHNGATPLWHAAYRGNADAIAALLEAGADPTLSGPHGTPLKAAHEHQTMWRRFSQVLVTEAYRQSDEGVALLEGALAR